MTDQFARTREELLSPPLCSKAGCTNPRYTTSSGRIYGWCLAHRREQRRQWAATRAEKQRRFTAALERVEAVIDAQEAAEAGRLDAGDGEDPQAPTRAVAPVAPPQATTPPPPPPLPPRGSDVAGIMADTLLVLARAQGAIAAGEIQAWRVAIDAGGVRVHMGAEELGARSTRAPSADGDRGQQDRRGDE